MKNNVILDDAKLTPLLAAQGYADKAQALLAIQKEEWDLLEKGYSSLEDVKVRIFDFGEFQVKVQFNPGRITSTSACVDEKTIKERKCFLCLENLPPMQKGIKYGNNYIILCNPYPIFREHFTLTCINHQPQSIKDSFADLLDFGKDLGKYYTVFYNGPKCGASAPDHLHFQAGGKSFMPIDQEYDKIKTTLGKLIFDNNNLKVYAVDKYLRRFFSFESSLKDVVINAFNLMLNLLKEAAPEEDEPLINILVSYTNDTWRIIIFPRAKHRSSHYFKNGDENLLISPASVDLGGVLITPLEKDFNKVTKQNIIDIFDEVTIPQDNFSNITERLAMCIR